MTQTALRRLDEVRMADAADVGGKAAGLGELFSLRARVPDGVVLTSSVVDLAADRRRELVRVAAGGLGSGPFAVRSSGVSEDGVAHSYAGIYETLLGVSADELPFATDRVLASARTARVAGYAPVGNGRLAVIIQRMVTPVAAGVALTADPITGDRRTSVITAVRGLGERLVSGAALGDEWTVRDGTATARRRPEAAIDRRQALAVAREARRIASARGVPQDVEWAIDAEGALWILQARPMTALPPELSWDPPAPGAYTRSYRFGEWISEPVTPLFESWLLTAIEDQFHACLQESIGQRAPHPHHVVVNGWYFYSLNWASARAWARNLPAMLRQFVREPRSVAGIIPPFTFARFGVPILERAWREDLQPRYRAAVALADARVASAPVSDLPVVIDELAGLAGEYFTSLAALSGAAYKLEINLARFYQRHLRRSLGGTHLPLVAGLAPPTEPTRHAIASLDWWHAPAAIDATALPSGEDQRRVVEARLAAESAALTALASSPRRHATFRRLLADAQHLVPIREEQTAELTTAWPVMRRAIVRIGAQLAANRLINDPDDVFFLTRGEALAALNGGGQPPPAELAARRSQREDQARLVPPLVVGRVSPMLQRMWGAFPKMVGAVRSDRALVTGSPASPGKATGPVRVVRGPEEFSALQPGEVLVAPMTAPAWTPLFTRAAAVVTDVGSAAAHASIIAREYGIPAVVGCGDATARLRDGMVVIVDGSTGNVEASP